MELDTDAAKKRDELANVLAFSGAAEPRPLQRLVGRRRIRVRAAGLQLQPRPGGSAPLTCAPGLPQPDGVPLEVTQSGIPPSWWRTGSSPQAQDLRYGWPSRTGRRTSV